MEWLTIILPAFVVLFLLVPKLKQVSITEAANLIKEGAAFIDVRTKKEFERESVPGSRNIPMQSLGTILRESDMKPDEPVLLFCHSGARSSSAQRQLKKMGFTQVFNVGSFSRARKAHSLAHATGPESNETA